MNTSEKATALSGKDETTHNFSETASADAKSAEKPAHLKQSSASAYNLAALKKFLTKNSAWIRKISAAIMDQVFFAGSNFVINVLLARWMLPDQYGAFVVAYSWFLLPQGLYEAVLTEPLNVFGAGKYAKSFKTYLGYVFYGHIFVSLAIAGLLGIGAAVAYYTDSQVVGIAIAGAAITAPLMLTRWLVKAPFYILSKPHLSVISGILYLIFCLVGMYVLHFGDLAVHSVVLCPPAILSQPCLINTSHSLLTPFTALAVMGIAGVISSFVMTSTLLRPNFRGGDPDITFRIAFDEHWEYGKWSLPYRITTWISPNVYYIALPLFVSLAESGALRALMNLVLPILLSMNAVTALLLPSFVRTYQKRGKKALDRRVYRVSIIVCVLTIGYFFSVVLFGGKIMHIVYDGKYDDLVTLPILISMGLLPTFSAMRVIFSAALRAMGNVKQNFQATVIPTIFTLTGGMFFMAISGVLGTLIAQVIAAAFMLMYLERYYRNTEGAFVSIVQNRDDIVIDSEIFIDD